MTTADLREIALKLPGVTEDIKWEDHLCFNIGEKMFLVTSPDSVPVTASFKVAEEDHAEMLAKGFTPQPYLAKHHWIRTDDISKVSKTDWEKIIPQSYRLIAAKLPKKFQKEIGL